MPLESLEAFDAWLRERWNEKEVLLDQQKRTGSFPSDAAPIVTEVKLGHWMELWGIYGLLTSITVGIAFLFGIYRWLQIA